MNKKKKNILDIDQLISLAFEEYKKTNPVHIPSTTMTEVAESGKDIIVVLKDEENNILEHYLVLNNLKLIKLNLED